MRALLLTCSVLACAAPSLLADAYQFDFSSLSNPASNVVFNGSTDTFSFQPDGAGSLDFVISGSGAGDLDGLFGSISGTYTIGAVTGTATKQQAEVTGSGQFSITDGAGFTITAELDWLNIATRSLGGTTLGALNTLGTVNLTDFSGYAGSNTRLQSLANNNGDVVMSFNLGQGVNLTALVADGSTYSNAYSGSATVDSTAFAVPDSPLGPCAAILWLGLMVTARVRRPNR